MTLSDCFLLLFGKYTVRFHFVTVRLFLGVSGLFISPQFSK